jgi:hypothetical protein
LFETGSRFGIQTIQPRKQGGARKGTGTNVGSGRYGEHIEQFVSRAKETIAKQGGKT